METMEEINGWSVVCDNKETALAAADMLKERGAMIVQVAPVREENGYRDWVAKMAKGRWAVRIASVWKQGGRVTREDLEL